MSTTNKAKTNPNSEAGMVAIMVTMILLIVISLIVIGFAQISRRNQRQSLDRQLSAQAFYAAETAVNDAAELIKGAVAGGTAVAAKPDCTSNGGGFYTAPAITPVIDAGSNVAYTCLMVNPTPTTLVYSDVGTTGTVVPLIATAGTISSLTMTWQSKDDTSTPANNCPANPNVFPATSGWNCGYGLLRFDLVPSAGSGLTFTSLQNATMTSFVVPLRPGGTGATPNPIGYTTGGGNNRLAVLCSNTNCTLTINGLNQSQYHLRVTSLYKDVSLQISATAGAGGPVSLQGAQAVIDATGKAQDVLRRIQVRVPLSGSSTNLLSDYAVQSTDAICKRFSVMEGYFASDAENAVPGVRAGNPGNPLCE
jgi:Tfp pilus assembly protein PilX